uniref:Thyroglobulin type-1 domain-containing protein n=1 Tax=Latimeria chalumnae TaxID=7897 RepID=H3A3M7_LATCH
TKCEVERFTAEQFGGVFTVSCDENGNYHPIQCQRGGQCWCVDSSGLEIFGTRQQGGTLDCEPVVINHMFSVAEKQQWYSPSSPIGGLCTACSEAGDYEEVQCYKAECWCVDPQGREASGSRVQGKKPRCPSRCEKEQERAKVLKASLPAGSQVFIPSCAADGGFRPLQCAGKSCFCVDLDGKEIPGTSSSFHLRPSCKPCSPP